jgi:hypothetical protein
MAKYTERVLEKQTAPSPAYDHSLQEKALVGLFWSAGMREMSIEQIM